MAKKSGISVQVSTDLKVARVHKKVNSAFKVFTKAHAQVEKAVAKMESIIKSSDEKIADIEDELKTELNHKEQALATLERHNEVLEKLSTFLPK